ncbi:MAG: abortive infection family protein [Thermoleophilia bacterium]
MQDFKHSVIWSNLEMKVSPRSIKAIRNVVTGDDKISPYRSGPKLVDLFNEYGAHDSYGKGFPSRWQYAEAHLRRINDTSALAALLCEVLDPREFLDSDFEQVGAVEYLNDRLKYDGYKVLLVDGMPKVQDLEGSEVEFRQPFEGSEDEAHVFIDEQLTKANDKIREGDYDGAITNARSLLEAALIELEFEITGSKVPYDGDLLKLYRRVQKALNLDPARPDLEPSLKQVLTGLISIVNGIAGVSNKMGDRHVRTYKPDKRHAVLVVNATKTIVSFLFETSRSRRL